MLNMRCINSPVFTNGCEIHCTITEYYSTLEQNYAVLLFLIDAGNVDYYTERANYL